MVVLQNPDEEHLLGRDAAEASSQSRQRTIVQPSVIKPITAPPRVKLLSNLALVALLGSILLALSLWLGGLQLSFLPTIPVEPAISVSDGPYRVGGTVTLQGAHFSSFAIVALLLDGEPLIDSNGMHQAIDTDGQGTFSIMIAITAEWGLGDHILTAYDTANNKQAAITITVEKAPG
jgi:hypothetical protein